MPYTPSATDGDTDSRIQNRSLERGIEILRAFRPGSDLLGNGEIAERTGLSRATVSRLTQTLAGTGVLEHDRRARAYRLGAPVLSFALAMRNSYPILQIASPMMQRLAETQHINVGLATPDRDEMVYLESIRYNRKVTLRSVVAGQRVPIELTSLGRAYLSTLTPTERTQVLDMIDAKRTNACSAELKAQINRSIADVQERGFCAVSWQPEVVALSTPLVVERSPAYVLNVSVTTRSTIDDISDELAPELLKLRAKILEHFTEQ